MTPLDAMNLAYQFLRMQEEYGPPMGYGTATIDDAITNLRTAIAELESAAMTKDAERYQILRRGQHWSVINGIGDVLRGDILDAAIDEELK